MTPLRPRQALRRRSAVKELDERMTVVWTPRTTELWKHIALAPVGPDGYRSSGFIF